MGVVPYIDISAGQRKVIQALLERHLPGTEAWAYGSRAKWTSRPQSDLDLVVFAKPEQTQQVGNLREAFEESDLPFRIDLFVWDEVPDSFREQIEAEHVVLVETKAPFLNAGWHEYNLGNLTDNFDYLRVPVKKADRKPGPYPYYGASGIVDYVDSYIFDGKYLLVAEDGENLRTRKTPIAFLADGKFWVNNHAHILRGNRKADTRFLSYALSQLDLGGYLTGSTMPKLTRNSLDQISLFVPRPEEQRVIANILGALDDKIELNRRMNETLEAMARTLFKSWFVDFDPVRAKMEGRDTGLPKQFADLFPDRLVASEIGEIPEGWMVKNLGDLLVLAYGKALKSDSRQQDGEVPVYGSRGQVGWHDERLVRGPGIVVGRKGNPGVVTWVNTDFFCIDTTFYVVRKEDWISLHFLFHALENQGLSLIAADSAVPGLNRNLAYFNRQVVPTEGVMSHFDTLVQLLFSQVDCLHIKTQNLASLRDMLLPKLISGEVHISDLDRKVEASL